MIETIDTPKFSLPTLSEWRKSQLLRCALKLLKSQQQMVTADGKNILHYTLCESEQHLSNIHYPKGDRIDKKTGAQYFYHCHRENFETLEHGHFHCFMRYKQIPKHIKPKPLYDWDKYIKNPMTHLVAIAMNRLGQPIRLFTVSRWVTSEIYYDAKYTPGLIRRFHMALEDKPYWMILDQWVESMLHLFSPQIIWLNRMRDQAIELRKINNPKANPYEDRRIEELSSINIDLNKQIQWIVNHEAHECAEIEVTARNSSLDKV